METMTASFVPVLPDPPVHHHTDYNASVCWSDIKSLLIYKGGSDNRLRVVACKTDEEFQAESLAATFSQDHKLIGSWEFK